MKNRLSLLVCSLALTVISAPSIATAQDALQAIAGKPAFHFNFKTATAQ